MALQTWDRDPAMHGRSMNVDPDSLQFSRDILEQGSLRHLRRAAERGRLVRVHRGAFLPSEGWRALTETEQYTYRILGAVGSARVIPVVSHVSAAVLHGAPIIGPLPSLVHVLATQAAGTRTEHGYRKHATPFVADGLDIRGELRMTSLVRTLAEVAADSPFLTAIGMLDWALSQHPISKDDIVRALDDFRVRRGRARALRAIDFADARAGSPGESLSRVRIHQAGMPPPELQVEFGDARGRVGIVDFWWPDHQLIGEFDGVAKYMRDEFTGGRTPAEVVIAEKQREDRLRALGPVVVRWGWPLAWSDLGLEALLRTYGLPVRRRRLG